jgi:hypothetical protein
MRHANAALDCPRAARFADSAFAAAAVAALGLVALVAVGARSWIDRPFAGFFVRADRTIAPIGRADWSSGHGARLYDRTVVAVDGVAVPDGDALQRRVDAHPVGSPIDYTLTDGSTSYTVTVPSRRFTAADYWAVFGAHLATGACWVLLAILAVWALPGRRLGRALLFLGGVGGLFMISAVDVYPPAASLRVHALAAAFLPVTLLQFALVVGRARNRFVRAALPIAWAVSVAAAFSMQGLLGNPAATRAIQATCDATLGLALVAATIGLARRVRLGADVTPLVACTAFFGLGIPAAVFLLAGAFGSVPVNASATLAFLFPLGMTAALVRGDTALVARPLARFEPAPVPGPPH